MFETLPIVTDKPVILVGGGWVHTEILADYAQNSQIIALDGGADTLKRLGYVPDCIIGDRDSLSGSYDCPIHHLPDQNSTDFDKALRNMTAPSIVAFGVLGDRLDHGLASLQSLARHKMATRTVLIGRQEAICYVIQQRQSWSVPVGIRLSVWCLQDTLFTASQGLKYPLDGLCLGPSGVQGTSNATTESEVVITKDNPDHGYFLMLPVEYHDRINPDCRT